MKEMSAKETWYARGTSWGVNGLLLTIGVLAALTFATLPPRAESVDVKEVEQLRLAARVRALAPATKGDYLTTPSGVVVRVAAERRTEQVDIAIACSIGCEREGYRTLRALAEEGVTLMPAKERDKAARIWAEQDPALCCRVMPQ